MEYSEFTKLIGSLVTHDRECEWLEFKQNFHSESEIGQRISAIANSACLCEQPFGYIVFGVDDQSLHICGTDLYATRKKVGNEELESWLYTRLNPRIDFEVIDNFDTEDGKHLCVFKIPASVGRPTTFQHEAFVRIGSTTRRLRDFPEKEAKIWGNKQKDLDKIFIKSGLTSNEIVTLLSAETYFGLMNLPIPSDNEGVVNRFISERIVVRDEFGYSITLLGALLFAKRLSDFDALTRKMIRVIVYKGKSKIETEREQAFDKGYAVGFQELITWVNSQLPANEEIGSALRKDARMYPEIAIRELIANMIIHQDFAERGFPMIEIYSDRIEISNPGLPLIQPSRFIDEYQSRNDSLADIMRRMGVCEEKGSGMDKVTFSIELYQLPPFRIETSEHRTTAKIFAYRKFSEIDRSERVLACYQHACLRYVSNEKMNNQSLRSRLGIEDKNYPMASRIIKDTVSEGLIKEEAQDGSARHNYVPFWV